MKKSRAKHLIEALIHNKLSRNELDELLQGLSNKEILSEYSEVLMVYFDELLTASRNNDKPPE